MLTTLHKVTAYLWIAYLVSVLSCVQSSFMHLALHASNGHSAHSVATHSTAQKISNHMLDAFTVDLSDKQGEQTLSSLVAVITLILGALLLLSLFSSKYTKNKNIKSDVTKFLISRFRRKKKRKYISKFIASIGLRAPPIFIV